MESLSNREFNELKIILKRKKTVIIVNEKSISIDSVNCLITICEKYSGEILEQFDSPGPAPSGLTFINGNLISFDKYTDIIYIHNGISSTILATIYDG